jgi:hypothetical protein
MNDTVLYVHIILSTLLSTSFRGGREQKEIGQ